MDIKSYTRWDDYTKARDDMFAATDTAWAPWYVARSDDKRRARLNIISHILSRIPYQSPPREKVKLPKRKITKARPVSPSVKVIAGEVLSLERTLGVEILEATVMDETATARADFRRASRQRRGNQPAANPRRAP